MRSLLDLRSLIGASALITLIACGDDDEKPTDTADAQSDGDTSVEVDTSPDAAEDTSPDAAEDTRPDSADDSGPEAVDDSGSDGDVQEDPARVTTASGDLQGAVVGATRVFLGVPYAAPPVGELRWRAPRPPAPWAEPRDATARGPSCPQPDFMNGVVAGAEDCLTLNVWAPVGAADAPVMLWLHGGGYFVNSGGDPGYDGRHLSEATGAIVVTINYRLGALGFLAHAALADEDPEHLTAGNYGHEDQRAALEWVRDNITAFGGDPANVTLFGQSAGATSTCLHMLSPRSSDLFQRAIIQSGDCGAFPKPVLEDQSAEVASALGCDAEADVLACLRDKPAEEIVWTTIDWGWGPVVDGWNIVVDPRAALAEGAIASEVPVIMGTTRDEAGFDFGMGFLPPVPDEDSLAALVGDFFGPDAAAILEQYSVARYGDAQKAATALFTDLWYVCPGRRLAGELVAAGVPVHLYSLDRAATSPVFPGAGAFHESDVAFIFGTPVWGIELDEAEQAHSRDVMGYWGRMAASGDPNGDDALAWPAFGESDQHMVFDLELSIGSGLRKEACEFWAGLAGGE